MAVNTHFQKSFQSFVAECAVEASSFLRSEEMPKVLTPPSGPSTQIIYVHRQSFSFWDYMIFSSGPREVHHHHYNQPVAVPRRSEQEQENDRAQMAKVVGTIVVFVGAFFVGLTYGKFSHAKQMLNHTEEMGRQIIHLPSNIRSDARTLVRAQTQIDSLKYSKARNYFLSAIGVLIGGGLLVGGGFASMGILVSVGYITTIASAVFALLNCGLHWSDNDQIRRTSQAIAGPVYTVNEINQYDSLAGRILRGLLAAPLSAVSEEPPAYTASPNAAPPAYTASPYAEPPGYTVSEFGLPPPPPYSVNMDTQYLVSPEQWALYC